MPESSPADAISRDEQARRGNSVLAEWFGLGHATQYPLARPPARWLVSGGRGSGKTRLGAEWVNGLVRGMPPFAARDSRYRLIALVGETIADVRDVMIEGPSGILTVARGSRPRFEATRRRLLWPNGATAMMFSSEDPESLRGPQFEAAWCDELGCPAVDKGPNQPNVFPDPKSTESALPYFSSGGRSDIAQQRLIEAHAAHWDEDSDGFDEAGNPISPVYGGRMVDASRQYIWAWDARPFPAFPLRGDRWSDNANWHYGHWLNGRLGTPTVGELINAILADHGLPPAEVTGADGTVQGYVIADPNSARAALEPICDLFGLVVLERPNGLTFRGEGTGTAPPIQVAEMVVEDGTAVLEKSRTPDHQLPAEAVLSFRDPLAEYQTVSVRQARTGAPGSRQDLIGFPGSLDSGQGRALLGERLRRQWSERERVSFAVTQPRADIVPGALVRLDGSATEYLVTEIEDGLVRKVSAKQVARAAPMPWRSEPAAQASVAPALLGRPLALFLDLPAIDAGDSGRDRFLVAAWQKPWKSQTVFASPEDSGYTQRATLDQPADIGRLIEALPPGKAFGRVDDSVPLTVELFGGEAASVSRAQLLNGANAVAVRSNVGAWEVLQFESAEEIAPEVWRLRGLLRGQLGTDDAAASGAAAGAWLVVLDGALRAAGLQAGEEGLALHWRVGRSGAAFSTGDFTEQVETGGLRALKPLSPAHLRSSFAGGDLALSWIRRGRVDADSWGPLDIPLGEDREEYRVDIAHAGGAIVRSATVATAAYTYTAAAIGADFGAPPAEIDVTVRQLSVAAGWGLPLQVRVSLD